jgi:hypothetical protein
LTLNAHKRAWALWLGWSVLVALLVFSVPLHLCLPLWPDTTLYDICARNILNGGAHYRDIFDNNFPGIVWLHALIRSTLGWSNEAIRLADLLILTGSIVLLTNWLRSVGCSRTVQVWTVAALFLFYFSTSEMSHCQRDPWALLPALVGFSLRCRQVVRLAGASAHAGRAVAWGLIEGLCWGAVVWIKPQLIVPGLACWLMSAVYIVRASNRGGRRLLADLVGLLCGGLIAGGMGIAWLRATGAWSAFLELFLDWNREYLVVKRRQWGLSWLVWKMRPWGLIHFLAVPAAFVILIKALVPRLRSTPASSLVGCFPALLAALYLGWVFQLLALQQGFDYHRVPATLLGLTLVAGMGFARGNVCWKLAAAGFLVWAAILHPMFEPVRATTWPLCLRDGSTPEVRDRLTLTGIVSSTEMDEVKEYIDEQHLQPGELTTFDWRTNVLYLELDQIPSTRFVSVDATLGFYPSHRDDVRRALNASGQRYVVTDLDIRALTEEERRTIGPGGPLSLPPAFPVALRDVFPWSEPIVFRSGRYCVHRVTGPVKTLVPDSVSDARQDPN